MKEPTKWALPDFDESGTIESVRVTELGQLEVRFKIGEDNDIKFINYTVGDIAQILYKGQKILECHSNLTGKNYRVNA